MDTNEFDKVLKECRSIFEDKLTCYGPAWLLFRSRSVIDQIFIKVKRIRTLEENGDAALVDESRRDEFLGIINYCAIALIKMRGVPDSDMVIANPAMLRELTHDETMAKFDGALKDALELMQRKNHDYGDAWKTMELTSITDFIMIKVFRIINLMETGADVTEGVDSQMLDIINYALFSVVKIDAPDSEK